MILIATIVMLTDCSLTHTENSAKRIQDNRPVHLLIQAQDNWQADKLNAAYMNNLAAALLRVAVFLDNASPEEISKITYFQDSRVPQDLRGRRQFLVFLAKQYLYAVRNNVPYEDLLGQSGKRLTNLTQTVLAASEQNMQNVEQVRKGIDSNDFSNVNLITVE